MDNARSLLTINYKLNSANSFVSSVIDNDYYFFVGNHIDANNTVRPYDNEQDTLVSSYQGMIFGKSIETNDVSLMIRRIDWVSGEAYDMYDHRDPLLYNKNFYVSVLEGSNRNVFKCLENNNGGVSTVSPSVANVSEGGDDFFYPNDGYRWKYMYTISDSDFQKFGTADYIPVSVDANTRSQAVNGSIDVISVTSPGVGYSNYLNSSFTVSDIRLNGDPKKYGISSSLAKTSNGFYDACWLYIFSGAGSGQYRMIESYTSNATHNFVTLTDQFDTSDEPQNGSVFEISPSVKIYGDGRETAEADARAIIDSSSNTVSRIEIINRGQNYYHATAEITSSPSVGVVSEAGIVPILSPSYGHGYNPPDELGGKYAAVSVQLIGDENGTIVSTNDYSQIGIIKNPQFNSLGFGLTNQNRDFYTDEVVYKVTTSQLAGTVATTLDGNSALTSTLSISSVNGNDIAHIGDTIVISDSTNYQIANVVSVSDTGLVMDSTALWYTGSNTANVYSASVSAYGKVDGFSVGQVTITDAQGRFENGDMIIGAETGTKGVINSISISGVNKTFSTFMQTFTYIGWMLQGTFIPDEIVYQVDSENVTASFHSTEVDTATSSLKIYCTNQMGVFNTSADGINSSSQLIGETSGAIATLTNKYLPDLVYASGEIVYIEYGDPITRSSEKTETFRLVFAF